MATNLNVLYENKPCYRIHITSSFESFFACLQEDQIATNRKVCIVTDSVVAELYLNEMEKICKSSFLEANHFIFPSGEASKNMDVVQELYQHLISRHFDRHDLLIALGGGVVGDLTGFTAATYLRGIDFIQVPTTLLSQVDSSIGGKTGVDFMQYKNMVGAFYMPKMVYMNIHTLQTLPEVQFQSGMGEVIKHGLICDGDYFHWLKDNASFICQRNEDVLEQMVAVSCEIKKRIVEEDPKEKGIRAHLNFGHTVGHAIEKLSNFSLFHGQCVAIGMHAASYLSWKHQMISEEDYNDILTTITSFGLPVSVDGFQADDILAATKSDKKMIGSKIKFILLERIGYALIDTSISDAELIQAISEVIR